MPFPAKLDQPAILSAALSLLRLHGYSALSMRLLASHLGVRASSLYRHFANREDLIHALSERAAARLRTRIEHATESHSPANAFRAACTEYLAFAEGEPSLFEILVAPGSHSRPPVEGKRLWNTILHIVGNVTRRHDDTASAVAVWSFLHGFAILAKTGQFGVSGPGGGFSTGVEALLRGLTPTRKPTQAARR